MKKRLTLILAVALVFVTCTALLIGCTPSKPNLYMDKWNASKNKSLTSIQNFDEVLVEKGPNDAEEKDGRTTIETTVIKNEKVIMEKVIYITNVKDKNGKFAKTDDIVPKSAIIIEFTKDDKCNKYTYELVWEQDKSDNTWTQKGVWTCVQMDKAQGEQDADYKRLTDQIASVETKFAEMSNDFENKFEKKKGEYISKEADENGYTQVFKIKSGEMLVDAKNSEGKVVGSNRFDLSEKVTISSGAKDALTAFLETKEATITKIEQKKGKNVYTFKIDGVEKEQTANEKVIGYDLLANTKVGDKVSLRYKKGFFGSSISDIYGVL